MRIFTSTEKKETWKKGIKITDLKEGDIIYVCKSKCGFSVTLECEFIKYEKGLVYAKVLAIEKGMQYMRTDFPEGMILRARRKKCFLVGKDPDNRITWAYCHWFGRD